jgi:hypothetical protein
MLSALAAMIVLLAYAAAGWAVLARVFAFTTALERLAYGSIIGITAGTLALVPLASFTGLTPLTVWATAVATLAVAVWLGRAEVRRYLATHPTIGSVVARLDPAASLVIGVLTVRWLLLWRDALQLRDGGLWAGHEYVWSDWPTHLALVTRFAAPDGFPPQHIHYAGLPLSYHYLSDLTPAAFVVLGMDVFGALQLHSLVLSVLAALAIWAFARRMTGRRSAATLGMVLFLMGAGLGWLVHLGSLDLGDGPISAILADPWDPKEQGAAHIRVFNPYLAFLMSQRAYLYGLPVAMFVLSGLRIAAARRSVILFMATGAVAGLLPLAHLPTLLALAIVIPVLGLALLDRPWRIRGLPVTGWIAFGGTWVLVSLPQLLVQLGGGSGALSATRLQIGWVASEGQFGDTWVSFWVKNAGLLGILCLVAVVVGLLDRHSRPGDRLVPPRAFRVLLALQVIFVVVNTVVFQPWDWDDHKILVYWMLSAAVLAAALLIWAWRRVSDRPPAIRLTARAGLVLLVVGVIAGPTLENVWMLQGGGRYRLLDGQQIALARRVAEVVPAGGVVVTGMGSHDPVQMLSGRQVLMGYWGQLWVSGIDHRQREAEVLEILRLGPRADELIERYGIAAVVIGPGERDRLGANDAGYAARFPLLGEVGAYRVYDTR